MNTNSHKMEDNSRVLFDINAHSHQIRYVALSLVAVGSLYVTSCSFMNDETKDFSVSADEIQDSPYLLGSTLEDIDNYGEISVNPVDLKEYVMPDTNRHQEADLEKTDLWRVSAQCDSMVDNTVNVGVLMMEDWSSEQMEEKIEDIRDNNWSEYLSCPVVENDD